MNQFDKGPKNSAKQDVAQTQQELGSLRGPSAGASEALEVGTRSNLPDNIVSFQSEQLVAEAPAPAREEPGKTASNFADADGEVFIVGTTPTSVERDTGNDDPRATTAGPGIVLASTQPGSETLAA